MGRVDRALARARGALDLRKTTQDEPCLFPLPKVARVETTGDAAQASRRDLRECRTWRARGVSFRKVARRPSCVVVGARASIERLVRAQPEEELSLEELEALRAKARISQDMWQFSMFSDVFQGEFAGRSERFISDAETASLRVAATFDASLSVAREEDATEQNAHAARLPASHVYTYFPLRARAHVCISSRETRRVGFET